jgi:type IV secretory pathway TrbL component
MGMRAGAAFVGRAAGATAPARSMGAFSVAETATQSSRSNGPPDWARRMRREQAVSNGLSAAAHAVRSGDHGGGSTSVDLKESR